MGGWESVLRGKDKRAGISLGNRVPVREPFCDGEKENEDVIGKKQ